MPSYIPEPNEISDSISEKGYADRLSFIRKTLGWHFATLLAVLGLLYGPLPHIPTAQAGGILLGVLALLSVVRTMWRGRPVEVALAGWLLPLPIGALALFIQSLPDARLVAVSLLVPGLFAMLYGALCGRDFSFVGQYLLSLIASAVMLAGFATALRLTRGEAWLSLGVSTLYLTYFVYDFAALMFRRRKGEELAATLDFFRDPLNFFGYTLRVIRHWKKHKIWSVPRG